MENYGLNEKGESKEKCAKKFELQPACLEVEHGSFTPLVFTARRYGTRD